MLKYIRLVRFINLLMVAIAMILVRYCLIFAAYNKQYNITGVFPSHLSTFDFTLLVLSTIFIASGGYIINDIFDVNIDEINRPNKNNIGKSISVKLSKTIYYSLSSVGVILGFYVAIKISKPVMGMIPLFSSISLWMYSSHYKRRLISGNILVSVLTSLSVLIVGLFEPEFYGNFVFLTWYAILAFLLSMIREIIKDIEDIDGDELAQCKTAPIIFGIQKTKWIIYFLILLTAAYILLILYKNFYINTVLSFWYMVSFFLIPLLALFYLVFTAEEKKDYYYASLFSKFIMLAGILTLIPFWFYFLK